VKTEQLIRKHTVKGENMPDNVQLSLNGKAQECAGEITGSGNLKFETDAASLCFELDYKSKDKVILTLSGTQGIKLSASSRLKFSESISKNLVNSTWEGKYTIKLEINKTIAAQLSQEFSKIGPKISAEITIKF
jgi:hypothetical protein